MVNTIQLSEIIEASFQEDAEQAASAVISKLGEFLAAGVIAGTPVLVVYAALFYYLYKESQKASLK